MKKIFYITLAIAGLLMAAASCNNTMTYADHLRAEERAISRFISENNFVILNEFPRDTVFPSPNHFFRDPTTGVYFNIVSRGNLNDRIEEGRELYVRFRGLHFFMTNDTIRHSNDRAIWPIEMVFRGPVTMQNRSIYEQGVPAFIVPLRDNKIGNNGRVRMIVPFNMGDARDRQSFQPTFFSEIDYTFEGGWIGRSAE
jgi:hypothetical protein